MATSPSPPPSPLSEPDLSTVRQLYTEVQNWTRHYEQLIVNANVLIVSSSLILLGLAFGEKISLGESYALFAIPLLMAGVGATITITLFRLYALCIVRLIRLEKLLGCDDAQRFAALDGQGALIPAELHQLPVSKPTSVTFFLGLYAVLSLCYALLALVRWLH